MTTAPTVNSGLNYNYAAYQTVATLSGAFTLLAIEEIKNIYSLSSVTIAGISGALLIKYAKVGEKNIEDFMKCYKTESSLFQALGGSSARAMVILTAAYGIALGSTTAKIITAVSIGIFPVFFLSMRESIRQSDDPINATKRGVVMGCVTALGVNQLVKFGIKKLGTRVCSCLIGATEIFSGIVTSETIKTAKANKIAMLALGSAIFSQSITLLKNYRYLPPSSMILAACASAFQAGMLSEMLTSIGQAALNRKYEINHQE